MVVCDMCDKPIEGDGITLFSCADMKRDHRAKAIFVHKGCDHPRNSMAYNWQTLKETLEYLPHNTGLA
jgi:hypothetical protein